MPFDTGRRNPAALWLPSLRQRPAARMRLFCFPYAGGSAASFVSWTDRLPEEIDVRPIQLPGRWNRIQEPPLTRVDEIVAAVAPLLAPLLDRPYAFFGHSMGALLAFESARWVERQRWPSPARVIVSGRRAPQIPTPDLPPADLGDAEFIAEIQAFNGTPAEVFASEELTRLVLPALRADFEVCRSYAYVPGPPLECPLTVLCGREDEENASGFLEPWAEHTSRGFTLSMFPGDHFYLHSASAALLAYLADSLHESLATCS